MAIFRSIVLLLAVAMTLSAVSAEEEGCVVSSTECTCAESPAAGECTRPTDGGNCLQGDCTPSQKCDCFGYELCAINKCGKWAPAVNAILSRTAEFQCKYEADGSKCRTAVTVMDTMDAADNAKAASIKYVDDIAADEEEMAVDLKEAVTFKIQTLDAFRAISTRVDEVTPDEIEAVAVLSDEVVEETKMIVKEIAEASEDASLAYEAMAKARQFRNEAKENEAKAVAEELAEQEAAAAAKEKKIACVTCDAMKERITKLRKARRAAAKEAGTWTKKGRGSKSRAKGKMQSAKKRKVKVQLTTAQCIAKAQKVLNRLGGVIS